MAVLIACSLENRRSALLGYRQKVMGLRSGANRIHRHLDIAIGSVFKTHRARQARGQLTVGLTFCGAGTDRSPADQVGDVLRHHWIQQFRRSGHAVPREIQKQGTRHPQTGIDVVFVIDATGSMVWVHNRVRERIEALSQYVRNLVPLARFGVIAYRDYQDPEFVIRLSQPSFDIVKARSFMSKLDALGGGDIPEAVTEALRQAENTINWRAGAQRVLIVIGDAPPHRYEADEALTIAGRMNRRGARLSIVDSRVEANRSYLGRTGGQGGFSLRSPSLRQQDVLPAFRALAKSGGGLAVTLAAERQLMKTLALLIFDNRFHDELAPFLASLE